ncbi:MAG: ankyrin repeat domain-containing protein, partial [Victivallaceae bacterium]
EVLVAAKAIEHFMQYKPDVNILNNKGESALFIAVVNCNGSYARILSENKANPNLIGADRNARILFDRKDHSFCTTGKSLLDMAIMQGAYDVVTVLKRNGAKTSEELKK